VPTADSSSLLATRIENREAVVAVIGLGFAGFPQAVEIAKSGLRVIGIDVDAGKVAGISAGESLSPDVPDRELQELQRAGLFSCSTDYASVCEADIIVACLPTPLDASRQPDLRFVAGAAEGLRGRVRAGQLLLLESTVPPGTTRRLFAPVLEGAGLVIGRDAFLAFAPERIDPGNKQFPLNKIPRLVGGITPACTSVAGKFYSMFVDQVSPVSSPEVAEMSKNVENTFRFINISFINEVAMLCDRMGISVWEVVQAASTKPFAFMPHYPGPGVGGHCIPIVPFYLQSVAREYGAPARIIDAAGEVNASVPDFVTDKLERELGERGVGLKGARILVLGVTYKPDVPDLRESAALRVMEVLLARGAKVSYYDPYVREVRVAGRDLRSEARLDPRDAAGVIVATPHKAVDYDRLERCSALVFDAVNFLPANFPADVVKL
jgi:UDP-N-acetyl-D-glucosamine dehydrogenase